MKAFSLTVALLSLAISSLSAFAGKATAWELEESKQLVTLSVDGKVTKGDRHRFIFFKKNDKKIKLFDEALNNLLLNLAKRVAADGEGASKFITVSVNNAKNQEDAKKVAFSIANSPLVKTAIAGEDCNFGRVIMAVGKSGVNINLNKLLKSR